MFFIVKNIVLLLISFHNSSRKSFKALTLNKAYLIQKIIIRHLSTVNLTKADSHYTQIIFIFIITNHTFYIPIFS